MKKYLEHLRSLPERQRKFIIAGVVVFAGILGLASWPLWGSHITSFSTPSFLKNVGSGIQETKNSLKDVQNQAENLIDQKKQQVITFQTRLGENEFYTNEEQAINSVSVNVRKILIDPDKTIIWFRISNVTQNTIQIDPQSNIDITADGVTYLSQPLKNETLARSYSLEQGQEEIFDTIDLKGQNNTEGYISFQTLPTKTETFTLHIRNVVNKDTLKKWNYSFVFDTEKLQSDKAKTK